VQLAELLQGEEAGRVQGLAPLGQAAAHRVHRGQQGHGGPVVVPDQEHGVGEPQLLVTLRVGPALVGDLQEDPVHAPPGHQEAPVGVEEPPVAEGLPVVLLPVQVPPMEVFPSRSYEEERRRLKNSCSLHMT